MRALKFLGFGLVGLVVLAIVGFFVAPHVIDWNGYKGEIAAEVAKASSKELRVDGDIAIAWTTTATFRIDGIKLIDKHEGATSEVAAIESVQGEVALFPLISGNLEVLDLTIVKPRFDLRVDEGGRANWAPAPGGAAPARDDRHDSDDGFDDDLVIRNLAVRDGALNFANAASGQKIAATDIALGLKLESLDSPLALDGKMTLNGEPVTLKTVVSVPRGLMDGPGADIDFSLDTTHAKSGFDGRVVKGEVAGVDGTLSLDVPSVAKLAAWLERPLAKGQADPGAANLKAVFKSDGAVVTLQEAALTGKALDVKASGSVDASKETKVVRLQMTSGVLDIDKYLPPPAKGASPGKAKKARKKGESPFAELSDVPIELDALKTLDAEIDIDIGGVKARELKLGKTTVAVRAKGGKLNAEVKAAGFVGGAVDAALALDGAGGDLALDLSAKLVKVNAGPLSQMGGGEKTLGGKLNLTLSVQAKGESPRALAQAATGKLALAVGRVLVKDGLAISKVALNIDAPWIDQSPKLEGSLLLNKEKVTLAASLDPIAKVLSGHAFKAKLDLAAKRLKLGYDGKVKGGDAPSLDGTLALSVPSVAGLARWVGQPLPKGQRDPGPLDLKAVFKGEGTAVALESATLKGKALDVSASGSFDGGKAVKVVRLKVKSGVLDLDRYLPAPSAAAPEKKPAETASAKGGNPPDALLDEALDLEPLKMLDAEIDLALGGVKARQLSLGKTVAMLRSKAGKATAKIAAAGFFGGKVDGKLALDGAGKALALDLKLALVEVKAGLFSKVVLRQPLLGGALNVDADLKATGASPRALAKSAIGKLALAVGKVSAPGTPPIEKLALKFDAPGLDKQPSLDASLVFNKEPVSLKLTSDPAAKILSGEVFIAKLDLTSKPIVFGFDGKLKGGDAPSADGELGLDIASIGKLAAWLGAALPKGQPDPGKLKIDAVFASDGPTTALKSATIDSKALKATASGHFVAGRVPWIEAKVNIAEADLDAYLPSEKQAKKAKAKKAAGWSEDPLPLEALHRINARVEVVIGKLRIREIDVSKANIGVALEKGVMTVKIPQAGIAGGTLALDATVDGSKPAAAIGYKTTGSNIAAQPFLTVFADLDRISGTLKFEAEGTGAGGSEKAILSSLAGKGVFKFLDGAIHGINVAESIRQARMLGASDGDGREQKTDFAELSGTYSIAKGVLRNDDLKMLAPLLRMDGKGTVPMPPRKFDYGVTAKLVGSLEGQGGKSDLQGVPIPVKVTGSWDDPKINIDFAAVLTSRAGKGIGDALKSITGAGGTGASGTEGEEKPADSGSNPLGQIKGLFKK